MPSSPFSEWITASRPAGMWSATSVGMPMPRFTYQPSGMSRATRAAICARSSGLPEGCGLIDASAPRQRVGDVQHAIDEYPRRDDRLGVDRAEFGDVVGLD